MKMKFEREQGMTSIYRKLRKECLSFTLRRHVTTLILAVAMLAPAAVYAQYAAQIVSEKSSGQAEETGWADSFGNVVVPEIVFEGHGVVQVVLAGVPPATVHGSARVEVYTVDTAIDVVVLYDCDPQLICTESDIIFSQRTADFGEGSMITVDLKGAFQQTIEPFVGYQRGTLTLKITAPLPPP
jgi:hypothetical protein